MLRYLPILILPLIIIFCDSQTSSPVSPAKNTEKWRIVQPGTANYADIIIISHENGSLSCGGNWFYKFFGNNITCKIMQGVVTKDSSYCQFICSGTGAYPADSSGKIESCPFTLTMKGQFKKASSSGMWTINFSDEEWDEWAPDSGSFSGIRQEGSGVTD